MGVELLQERVIYLKAGQTLKEIIDEHLKCIVATFSSSFFVRNYFYFTFHTQCAPLIADTNLLLLSHMAVLHPRLLNLELQTFFPKLAETMNEIIN
jgi:hypothetical protein